LKGRPDHFSRRAKDEGFEARSIYKLSAIDARRRLVRAGQRVLDLGAAPGSWSQYVLPKIGPVGFLVAVDLDAPRAALAANARFVQGSALDPALAERLAPLGPFDLILSDMAPKTSGVRFADAARSTELARAALALAERLLRPGGALLVKVFQGEDLPAFRKELAARFESASLEKPDASRPDSVEVFLLGKGFRPPSA
jgi:23S rRNA (uridine2552-2'-O)-methyltransferase